MASENNCKTFKETVVLEKCTLSCLDFQYYFVNFFLQNIPSCCLKNWIVLFLNVALKFTLEDLFELKNEKPWIFWWTFIFSFQFSILSLQEMASRIQGVWIVWRVSEKCSSNWKELCAWFSWCQWQTRAYSSGIQAFSWSKSKTWSTTLLICKYWLWKFFFFFFLILCLSWKFECSHWPYNLCFCHGV